MIEFSISFIMIDQIMESKETNKDLSESSSSTTSKVAQLPIKNPYITSSSTTTNESQHLARAAQRRRLLMT
jgi:hypothetical protein